MSTEDSADEALWMPLVERRIQEAMRAGEFDRLPGSGKPLPDVDAAYEPGWWVKKWVRRENLRELRRELDDVRAEARLYAGLGRAHDAVRRRVEELETRIARLDTGTPPPHRRNPGGSARPGPADSADR